jgi:hypothetical protein
MSIVNEVMEAVIGMMNDLHPFATVTRGALPTGNGITCEIGPTVQTELYFDKNTFVPLDITINGKHKNMKTLSDTLNNIHSSLTRRRVYPSGEGWQIADIKTATLPRIIGREENNEWLMASGLSVEFYWRGD